MVGIKRLDPHKKDYKKHKRTVYKKQEETWMNSLQETRFDFYKKQEETWVDCLQETRRNMSGQSVKNDLKEIRINTSGLSTRNKKKHKWTVHMKQEET